MGIYHLLGTGADLFTLSADKSAEQEPTAENGTEFSSPVKYVPVPRDVEVVSGRKTAE